MRKQLFSSLLIILFFAVPVLAQQAAVAPNNMATLEVQGTGRIRIQPDQTLVSIRVENTNTEAGRAVQQVTNQVEALVKKLQDAGFKKEELKTSQFFLNENNEWRDGRSYRMGYTASQTLEVRFPLDQKRMSKITEVFSNTQDGVTFHFSFGLTEKTRQQVREELIRKALQDAREKAAVIARSANIRLGAIQKIDYGRQASYPVPQEARAANMVADYKSADFPQTEIQELELSDQILVIWSIEQ